MVGHFIQMLKRMGWLWLAQAWLWNLCGN